MTRHGQRLPGGSLSGDGVCADCAGSAAFSPLAIASTLSYLLYLTLWNFQVVFTTAFLLYAHYLPKTGKLGFILFNAVLLIPIHAGAAILYADFIWKRLGRRLAWAAKALLAAPFLVVLVTYSRQTILRLARNPAPSSFQVSAPLSGRIMVLAVIGFSLAGILMAGKEKNANRKKGVMPIAVLTTAGIVIVFLLMGGNYTYFLSYILYGLIGLATNVPAFIVLAIGARRERMDTALRGLQASRLKEIGERYGLSEREREILALACWGRLNQEIARELHISLDTVKKHLYNVFKKTGVRSRVQLFLLVSGEEFRLPHE